MATAVRRKYSRIRVGWGLRSPMNVRMTSLGFNGLEFEVLHHDNVIASYAFSFSGIVVSGKLQT
jgi:hypothetical protein